MPNKPLSVVGNVVRIRERTPSPGGWLVAQQAPPEEVRDRIGRHVASTLESTKYDGRFSNAFRLLTDDQLWQVYVRVPDVRAAVDSIVRRVATWDWSVVPSVDPTDDNYEAALDLAEEARRFLQAPNENGETWQELWTKVITDLLVFDAGVIESVYDTSTAQAADSGQPILVPGDNLEEFVALRGADILPIVDEFGRVHGYQQDLYGAGVVIAPKTVDQLTTDASEAPLFEPRQIVYMRMYPTTSSVRGQPLLEVLINEIITMMRQSEHSMLAFDSDEIPPGILVLAGVAGAAAEAAKQEFKRMKGKDNKVRIITSPDPSAQGAKWVELRHTAKDVDFVNVVKEVRRTIWRVFGVMPVEMGESENVPRAVGAVQLEVGTSHLLNPILEMVESKVNARMLPLIVDDPGAMSLIKFCFDRETKLSPAEQLAKASSIGNLVDKGIMTRNEARQQIDLPPIDGGDVMTVASVATLLNEVVEPPSPAGGARLLLVGGDGDGGGGTGGDGEVDDPGAGTPDDGEEGPGELTVLRSLGISPAAARFIKEHASLGCACCGPSTRSALREELPSDWQPRGRFDGVRTMPLLPLWEQVAAYARVIEPLFDQVESEALALFAAEYEPGGLDDERALALSAKLGALLNKLESQWALASAPFYRSVSKIGRDAAADFTGLDVYPEWEERSEQYGAKAIRYLADGLLADIRSRLMATVQALTIRTAATGRAAPQIAPGGLSPFSSPGSALLAIASSFGAHKHRIKNWSGRLLELAYTSMREGFLGGGTIATETGEAEPVEWYAEWVHVGDNRMCETCDTLGSAGFQPLSQFPTVPGGQTQCQARCRCVLVLWTKGEVDSGKARSLSGS